MTDDPIRKPAVPAKPEPADNLPFDKGAAPAKGPAKPNRIPVKPAPQAAEPGPAPSSGASPLPSVAFGAISRGGGHRIVLYASGGTGKTTLAAALPGPVAFIDLDDSLGRLIVSLEGIGLAENVLPVSGVYTWQELRKALRAPGWEKIKSIVIDSVTLAEELCTKDVLATVPKDERGGRASKIEDYGYGKGYQHVYEHFLALLGDLDRHCRQGRHVCLIAHECTATVPNPNGEDYIRYEPRLQSPGSGKGSIRHRVKEWADHVLYIGHDIEVDDDGKAKNSGSRTLWPVETALCMAKSRTFASPLVVTKTNGTDVWNEVLV